MKKMKKGFAAKRNPFKAVGAAMLSMALAASLAFSACAVNANPADKSKSPADAPVAAATTQDTNSLRFLVDNNFEDNWNAAVKQSKSKSKQVYFVLNADWEAPVGGSNPFGADSDGFSSGRITVPAGADIVLDLNGHSINRRLTTYTQLGSVVCVDGGKLTLEDGAGGGTITGGFTGDYTAANTDMYDNGGGVVVTSGEFIMNGGTITGNRADCGGGVMHWGSSFIMNGGAITGNIADEWGGGIEIGGTGAVINGGEISYNTVTNAYASGTALSVGSAGGGIGIDSSISGLTSLTMNGGKIHHNTLKKSGTKMVAGGGVVLGNKSEFIMNGGEISYNSSDGTEGGIGIYQTSTIELNGGLITQNTQAELCAIAPANVDVVKIGGPVKIYDNFTDGAQGNLRLTKASQLQITGPIVSEKGSAYIGITTTLKTGSLLSTGYKANGGTFYGNYASDGSNYGENVPNWFFSDDNSSTGKRIKIDSNKKEVSVGATAETTFYKLEWQYQLNNDGQWRSTNGLAEIDVTYGDEVTAVRDVTVDTQQTAKDWQKGGTTTTYAYESFFSVSGISSTPFQEIKDVGKYTFAEWGDTTFWDDYHAAHGGVFCCVFPSSLTINIVPKEVRVNLIDKAHQYGDKVADLYAEEDVLDNAGQPTGDKIKAEVDPATPLLGADANYDLNTFITLSTEAVASSDLGSYTVKGALKSSAPFNTKNYKFTIKTATYSVTQATITVKLKGSNTYNGLAQNPTFTNNLEFVYPNGTAFAGTKLSSSDVTITCAKDLVNAKKYGKDDVTISLGTTANAKRFVLAETDPVSGEYEIKKAKLTCTADSFSIGVGDPVPTYTASYTGLVNGETAASVITTQPTFTCDYTTNSAKGDYTITPSGAAADNYEITYANGKVTVGTGSMAKPVIALASGYTGIYGGNEQVFNVTYNASAISSVTLSDSTNFVWDAATATIKATKAGKCKVTFVLDTSKYTWADGTVAPVEIEIEIKPMPLVFSFTATGDTNWKWDFGATGTLDYALTTTTVAGDTLTLYYHYYLANDPGSTKKAHTETSIKVSDLASGSYVAEVRLIASGEANYSAHNANYTIDSNSKNTQAFVIDAGGAETDGIIWKYSKNGDPETDLFGSDGTQAELKYGLKADGSPNGYTITAPDLSAVSYLKIDTARAGFTNGMKVVKINDDTTETEITGAVTLPGRYRIVVALISDDNHLFDDGTTSGEGSAEFEIARAEADLSNLKLEYGWYDDDKGEVVYNDYDPKNLPVYRDSWVYIRVKGGTNYPEGITNAEIVNEDTDYFGDRDVPGTVSAKVKFTLDPNYVYVKDGTTHENSFNETVSITLSKKKIPVSWTLSTVKDGAGNDVLDDNGLPYQIYVLDFGADPDNLAQYIRYEYYYADLTDPANPVVGNAVPATSPSGTTSNAQLDYLIDVDCAGKFSGSSTKSVGIFVRPVIDATVSGAENFVLDVPAGGADQFTKLGQKKNAITVTQNQTEIVYGSEVNYKDLYSLKKGTADYSENSYTAVIYKGNDSVGAVAVKDFDFSVAGVGTYTIKFELKASVANSDALSKTSLTLEITRQEIEVPQITGSIIFNSDTLNFADFLDGKYQQYLTDGIIKAVYGETLKRNAGSYTAVIEIDSPNYKWKLPADENTPVKMLLKASAADEEVSSDITLDGAQKQATYSWKIAPFKLGTDVIDVSSKDGAKININKLPEWARTMLTEGSLQAGIAYYADEAATTPLTDEEIVLKGGRSYFVGAVLGGEESGNFTFANDGSVKNTSTAITYKVPQSGAAAAWNTVSEFMTKTWLGLPIWAWFAIGLAVLLLLIIIIAVACKRRKSKEQRAEEKARKEEEKARREEERRLQQERLEQERRMQQEKIEAERELARAKQEAELEKIRAQAQMAGAGMAATAVQQPAMQAQQQPVPQSAQQQPVQQQQAMPAQQYQPMPMPQQMPVAMSQQQPQGAGMDSTVMLALLQSQAAMQAQITEMRATQDASAKAELELLKMQMLSGNHNNIPANYYGAPQNGRPVQQGISAELLGEAIVTAFTRLAANGAKPAELPAPAEPETATANSHAVYPPDAVVTTTTTVDTTQKPMRRVERDGARNEFVDVDGFYDSID